MKEWRYIFKNKPRPWWWIFSFWESRWKNYGEFTPIAPGEAGYEDAPYAMGIIYGRATDEFLENHDHL